MPGKVVVAYLAGDLTTSFLLATFGVLTQVEEINFDFFLV